MFKRYDLDVFVNDVPVYSASFSSINNLVKFACGFDRSNCDFIAIDSLFEKTVPIIELMNVFEGENYGI